MQSGVKLTSMEEIYIMALLPVHGPVYLELATDNHTDPALDNYKISFTENLLPTACPVVPTAGQATSRRQSMGTVPDPLRSAKLSLVTASAEDDHLGDLQSAKHQAQLPSGERASNGFPCTPSGSAGVCLFDLKCTAAASPQSFKQCHEDNAGQHETSPPGLASKAAEGHPVAVEPAGCSQPAGSWEPAAPAPAAAEAPLAAEAPSVGQGPEMMPAPQSSRQFVQGSQAKTSSLTQMDDSALKPQGTDDQPALEVLNYSSPGSPIRGNESCCTSQANLLQRGEKGRGAEKNASATCQSASPVRHTEADLGRDPQTGLEAKSGSADTALPMDNTEVMQSSETPAWSSPESPHPLHNPNTELESDSPPQLSKFRETGTMTVQPESSSPAQEAGRRTWRDAEVQAVATVESKSASTSPSILAALLKENPPPEEKEELHIIYQGGMGLSQFALTDSSSLQQKSPHSSGITSKSTVVTAVTGSAQPQPVKLPRLPSDTASAASADNAKHTCSSPAAVTSQGASVGNAEMIQATCDGKNAVRTPIDAPVPPKPIPVEQLAVDSSNQTPAQSGSGSGEPSSTPAAAVLGTEDNVRDLVCDAERSPLPLLCSTGSEVKQKEVLGSSEQKPVQSKGASQGEAVPNQSAVKPKEENLVVLGPAGGMNVSSQPAAVRVKVCSEDVGEKEESRGQGGTGQAQMAGSQSPQAGLSPEPGVTSRHLTPTLEAAAAPPQQDLQAKESSHQPHTAALPTSAQALPNLGENKKQPTPAMEAKVQVKQSKHVRDVVWDEQGMTWEVYGASLDAESLGIAIQNHLQRQIREHEKLIRAQNSQTRKSISSDTSSNKKLKGRQHNVFQSMLQNFRRPNCCVRPAPSSVLD